MARKPKLDEVIDGTRVRVFATRSEYEVIFNDDDIDDAAAEVRCYPKAIGVNGAARVGHAEWKRESEE